MAHTMPLGLRSKGWQQPQSQGDEQQPGDVPGMGLPDQGQKADPGRKRLTRPLSNMFYVFLHEDRSFAAKASMHDARAQHLPRE